jgi:hypothetical protein
MLKGKMGDGVKEKEEEGHIGRSKRRSRGRRKGK